MNEVETREGPGSLVGLVRARTPARLLEGRAGAAYRTATQLALRADHAAARDAVWGEVELERDLPGLGLFLLLLGQCLLSTIVVQRAAADRENRGLAAFAEALQASLLAFSVSALFHPVAYQFYLFYFAGLAVAARGALAAEEHGGAGT